MHHRILLGLGLLALAAPARAGTLRGAVVDAQTREPLAGVTIVVSATSGAASETAISEEDGSFVVEMPAGTYLVTYFYGDLTIERRDVVIGADGQVDLVQALDSSFSYDGTGCYFGPSAPMPYDGAPADHTVRTPADVPLVRLPDHLALAGLDARLGPRHAATTVGGAVRLPGAPAIAGELLTEVAVASTAPAIALPGATGGTLDATLRHGSNQHRGGAALELGPRARFVARDAGAADQDHVWWSTGVVLERATDAGGASGRHGAQVMLALDAMDEPGDASGVGVVGLATWTPDGGRDLWADGHAGLTGDDGKRAVVIGLSAEQLTVGDGGALLERVAAPAGATAGPTAIDRVAGRLGLTQRGRWHGYHTATVGGELGFGHADAAEHGDLRAYAGDEWTPRPNWTITGGVRWDRRAFGPAVVDAVLPRLAVAWDPSEEGARSWFATVERVAALDQDRLGAWRTAAAIGADQASVGYTRDWLDDLRVTLAGRARRAIGDAAAPIDRGAEVAVRWLPAGSFAGELTASTLTRRLVAQASYTLTRGRTAWTAAAVTEQGVDEHHWGAALATTRGAPSSYDDDHGLPIDLRLGLALFDLDDPRARGGRLTLAAAW